MAHVVLLGDSIFDNGAYVAPSPDVVAQLRAELGPELGEGWRATLLAVDGDVAADVLNGQIARIPENATHLVVSAGGADALGAASILTEPAATVAEATFRLADAQDRFRAAYLPLAQALAARGLPTALGAIYDANHPDPYRRIVVAALSLFNDVITRAAGAHGLDLIDLRAICDEPEDYANAIEPSARGGEKFARVVAGWVRGRERRVGKTAVWG